MTGGRPESEQELIRKISRKAWLGKHFCWRTLVLTEPLNLAESRMNVTYAFRRLQVQEFPLTLECRRAISLTKTSRIMRLAFSAISFHIRTVDL
jgi:hypothetical protein